MDISYGLIGSHSMPINLHHNPVNVVPPFTIDCNTSIATRQENRHINLGSVLGCLDSLSTVEFEFLNPYLVDGNLAWTSENYLVSNDVFQTTVRPFPICSVY